MTLQSETLSRRLLMTGGTALLVCSGLASAVSAQQISPASSDAFMNASQILTGGKKLDRALAQRLSAALMAKHPDLEQNLQQLIAALQSNALSDDQNKLASEIQKAWYMGMVDDVVISYEQAIMFAVTAGATPMRTYCPDQPGFWAAPPRV